MLYQSQYIVWRGMVDLHKRLAWKLFKKKGFFALIQDRLMYKCCLRFYFINIFHLIYYVCLCMFCLLLFFFSFACCLFVRVFAYCFVFFFLWLRFVWKSDILKHAHINFVKLSPNIFIRSLYLVKVWQNLYGRVLICQIFTLSLPLNVLIGQMIFHKSWRGVMLIVGVVLI